ncbi:MAG: ABC transporter permease [Rhizobiales bacterium]|nr:ABC transporter permease [Hyphomicrobiales bacterium]MBO6698325.1 ABC transporter permease [Hyphomicrobiales bacterium]MBO6735421.1 ABC transporter permease [Hyphomicrobiales bacterium]MBO6910771.1 ABC transporter permease [Hyphomicrobiales bacterium]MBO6956510.1 ABC transporter permease [Hyphomicrobiales bacterium]
MNARALKVLRDVMPYLGLILLVGYFSLSSEFFFNARNFERLATDSATLMLVAFGMTLVILIGEIDLSVSAVVGLLSVILAQFLLAGMAWPLAMALVILISVGIGSLNGAITVYGDIPSFIVTLGMLAIATGLAFVFTGAVSVAILQYDFLDLFYSDQVLGVAIPLFIVAIAFLACLFTLSRTRFGRELFAIGANKEAARLSGVSVKQRKVAVFAIMGLLVGLGAILSAARLGNGAPGSSPTLTLDAIAAVIIGGASLFGGWASVLRTLLGALLIAVLNNGMVLLNVNIDAQYVIKGVIILFAVVLERLASGVRS